MKEHFPLIEYVELEDLHLWEDNPRLNDKAVPEVKKSIEEYGFLVPVVIGKDNVIKAGNTRFKAARELGLKKIPVVRAEHLTEEQLQGFALADNKTAEYATWDMKKLSRMFSIHELQYVPGFGKADCEKVQAFLLKESGNPPPEQSQLKGKSHLLHTCPQCGFQYSNAK